jgi:hypothetical protein
MITDGSALAKCRVTFIKDVRGKVAAVGKFDTFGAAIGARLDDVDAHLHIGVIKHRNHALLHHCRKYCHAILCCHVDTPK